MAAPGLSIRSDVPAAELRMYAIANALEGMTRTEAARLAGLERQALRDAVVRYNAEGLAGLQDRPRPGAKPRLDEHERAALSALILAGPDVEATGLSAWTLSELCREVEARCTRFDPDSEAMRLHPASLSRVVRGLGFSRQKARPTHPRADPDAQAAFAKRGSRTRWKRPIPSTPASA